MTLYGLKLHVFDLLSRLTQRPPRLTRETNPQEIEPVKFDPYRTCHTLLPSACLSHLLYTRPPLSRSASLSRYISPHQRQSACHGEIF